MHYKLICILYALLCGQNFILVKSGCYRTATKRGEIGVMAHQILTHIMPHMP
jgi:hypothetical protein